MIPMEEKKCIIIGATTENPKFSVSSGIRSRMMIFEFKPLSYRDLELLLADIQKSVYFEIDESAKDYLISSSGGDARSMLNLLEYALSVDKNINLKILKTLRCSSFSEGSSSKDTHYNLISAMIKSLRGSDIDAAIYYLARLIAAEEEPEFLARRMVIFASEDIGNANPNALNVATNTMLAVSKIGYPEARIILSQCAIYLASSPKSNSSYKAINFALDYISKNPALPVPPYLINTNEAKKDYLYPHDFGGWVEQKYMQKDMFDYDSFNKRQNSMYENDYPSYTPREQKKASISTVEKKLLKQNYNQDTLENRLARIEEYMFGTVFDSDDNETRANRISSAYNAQKSSGKYDSNKFAQSMTTGVQIGMLILMVLACIL